MFIPVHNGTVHLHDDTMHYVRFGRGSKILIMLPGLGDRLTTVKGTALPYPARRSSCIPNGDMRFMRKQRISMLLCWISSEITDNPLFCKTKPPADCHTATFAIWSSTGGCI